MRTTFDGVGRGHRVDVEAPAGSPKRAGRRPVLELGDRSVRASVPLGRNRLGLAINIALLVIGGFYVLRLIALIVLQIVLGFSPLVVLIGTGVELIFSLFGIAIFITSAYRLWGRQVVTVGEGRAVLRFELWGRGYNHLKLAVGDGAAIEVVDDVPSGAHVQIDGFRTGAGLRRASFSLGQFSLTRAEAEQIAARFREVMGTGAATVE